MLLVVRHVQSYFTPLTQHSLQIHQSLSSSSDMLGSNHLRLPAGDANPPIVRKYLANILHFSYNVPAEHAEALVSGWQYGRGRELVHYDIATFRQIFGAEVGALLYHHMANKSHISTAPSSRMDNSMAKKDLFGLPPGGKTLILCLCYKPWFRKKMDEKKHFSSVTNLEY